MSNIFSSKSHFVQPNVVCPAPAVPAVPTFWSPGHDPLLEKAKNVEIFKKVSIATLKKGLLKKFVFGNLDVDVEEVDNLEDTSSSCTDAIEWKEEQRPTIVDEME